MRRYYFKAYDESGLKIKGTIEAESAHAADQELRHSGHKPYFIHDYLNSSKNQPRAYNLSTALFGLRIGRINALWLLPNRS